MSEDPHANAAAPGSDAEAHQSNIDELLPSDLIDEEEVVIFAIKPSLWSIVFVSFDVLVIAGVIALLAMFAGRHLDLAKPAGYIIKLCAAIAFVRLGFALLQWGSRTYVLTDRRVIRIRGVFTIDIFQCALGKLQNTFLTLTLPQRIFNLGNISFTTAGTGGVEAVWRHCRAPLSVHEKLLRTINAASNRAANHAPPASAP